MTYFLGPSAAKLRYFYSIVTETVKVKNKCSKLNLMIIVMFRSINRHYIVNNSCGFSVALHVECMFCLKERSFTGDLFK